MKEFLMAVLLFVIPALGAETLLLSGIVPTETTTKVQVDIATGLVQVENQNNFKGQTELAVVAMTSRGPASEGPRLQKVIHGQKDIRLQDLKGPRWLMVTISAP